MARREASILAHVPKQPAGDRVTGSPAAATQTGRCIGAAAQLAAVHRTLRHGSVVQLQAGGASAANHTGLPGPAVSRRMPSVGPSAGVVQLRSIPNLTALRTGLVQELNTGEVLGGSSQNLLSAKDGNIAKLSHLYTPMDMGDSTLQSNWLAGTVGNVWREGWFDRVDQRVRQGAQATTGDVLFWAGHLLPLWDAEAVQPTAVELLGDELHDRGLGPAKVDFVIELNYNPLIAISKTYVIKPEDRTVEKAILGSGDSVASRLNARLAKGRQVTTLDIQTHAAHGTMMEYVTTSLKTVGEWALRKVGLWDSNSTVTTETIALGMLTGLHDLHGQNVLTRGGAPALIDADVAARPRELRRGPSQQQGFGATETQSVQAQIGGNRSGASQILQYAIENPKPVTDMIKALIGNHRSRIVPVHTGLLAGALQLFVHARQNNLAAAADAQIAKAAKAVADGEGGSPGLTKELGEDRGNFWDAQFVRDAIEADFDRGVIPHFQYESATGRVFLHNQVIWQGKTLAQAMKVLQKRLKRAK